MAPVGYVSQRRERALATQQLLKRYPLTTLVHYTHPLSLSIFYTVTCSDRAVERNLRAKLKLLRSVLPFRQNTSLRRTRERIRGHSLPDALA